jgi:hypothetical protein
LTIDARGPSVRRKIIVRQIIMRTVMFTVREIFAPRHLGAALASAMLIAEGICSGGPSQKVGLRGVRQSPGGN